MNVRHDQHVDCYISKLLFRSFQGATDVSWHKPLGTIFYVICVKYVAKYPFQTLKRLLTQYSVEFYVSHFPHVLLLQQYSTSYCDFKECWPNNF